MRWLRRVLFVLLYQTVLIALLTSTWSKAQALPETVNPGVPGPGRYTGESIVVVRSESIYSMAADGTGWRQRTMVARVQSDAAVKQLSVLSIPFASSSERVEIAYARVRRPDGKVIESPAADALEMPEPVTQAAPFYSDLKQKQLPIRSLQKGDTLEWQVKIIRTKPEVPGEFWGQDWFLDDGVVLEQSIELRVPIGKPVTVWSPGIKAVENTSGGERIYRWMGSQLKPTTGKEAEDAAEVKKRTLWTADQETDSREGKLPTIAWTTFPSWEAVGAWYRGLEADRMTAGPEVRAKVEEVTAGKTTEEEKVRAVYEYVAAQIRYIGVAFGVGRYQPHRAAEVLENQYGDCKDKHTLLAAMLAALGLKADAVLVGVGVRFNAAVPSPGAFNHLITRVEVAGQPVWLDTTAEVAPYRMLLAWERDHSVLAIPQTGTAKVVRTPADLPFKAFQRLEASGSLDKEGVSHSKMTLTLRGDVEVVVRAALRQIPPAQYDQLVQQISQGMSFGGTASHAEISHADDTAEPLVIRYDYQREKAGDWDNLKTLAQLAPPDLPVPDEREPPVRAIDLNGRREFTSSAAMKLPEGWTAELPEAVHARSKFATWDQTYRLDKGTLYAERKIEVLVDRVPVSEWKEYKKWTDVTTLGSELYVQLRRGGEPKGVTVASAVPSARNDEGPSPVVQTGGKEGLLLAAATSALMENDVASAAKKLDEVKALNATQRFLWAEYAQVALHRGDLSGAMRDYEKEVSLHPDEVAMYVDMANLNGLLGKREEQVALLRKYLAVEPERTPVTLMLVRALMEANDPSGAAKAAEAGLQALPEDKRDDARLRTALGEAQIKAGMREKGAATLVGLLKTTDSAMTLNSASYELADAGEDLAAAEDGTRRALDKLSAESNSWTLDENQQTMREATDLLVATWDTMGWVLFREGKTQEAEEYLRASWKNRSDAVVGEHLGDVLSAEGKRVDAAKIYELAVAVVTPKVDALGRREDGESPVAARLRKKIGKPGEPPTIERAERASAAFQAMRVIHLGPADGRSGTAEYKMLIGSGGVERIAPTGEREMMGGAEMVKRAEFVGFTPKGTEAKVMRLGMVNCHQQVCELVLE